METIKRGVNYNGIETEMILEPGEKVKCQRCAGEIIIGDNVLKEINGEPYIVCPNRIKPKNEDFGGFRCGRITHVGYYLHKPKETGANPRLPGEVKIIQEGRK